jgi:hypothetical protein
VNIDVSKNGVCTLANIIIINFTHMKFSPHMTFPQGFAILEKTQRKIVNKINA